MTEAILSVQQLNKRFGKQQALSDISFQLQYGECVGLVGHNGAGKTTLIKLILALIQADSGEIRIHKQNVRIGSRLPVRIGYLPEIASFYPHMTGLQIMNFFARLQKSDCKHNLELLEKVGIREVAHHKVRTYSKGMRQRLALAQALIGKPELLLLDEPTSGLDPALRITFYNILDELREAGTAILLSSHALAEIATRVERIIIFSHGKLIADGQLNQLRRQAGLRIHIQADYTHATQDRQCPGWQSDPEYLHWHCQCSEKEKTARLAELFQKLGQPEHLSISEPTLDQLYAYYLKREQSKSTALDPQSDTDRAEETSKTEKDL